jgi:hypothetical protein
LEPVIGVRLCHFDNNHLEYCFSATSGSWVKGCARAYPKPVYFILPPGCEAIPFTSSVYASDLGDTDIDIDECDLTEKEEKEPIDGVRPYLI